MELNSFLFPAPSSSYTVYGSIGDLIYIPKLRYDEECLLLLQRRRLEAEAEEKMKMMS